MYPKSLLFCIIFSISCSVFSQNKNVLSISPWVDTLDPDNQQLVRIVEDFLQTKDESFTTNSNWLTSDFDRYKFPYADIGKIEYDRNGDKVLSANLMNIVSVDKQEKLVKIGFTKAGKNGTPSEIYIIYNIVAIKSNDTWKLKRAIDYQTKSWQEYQIESLTYLLPPGSILNESEVDKQLKDIEGICQFFELDPIAITYYSCNTPKQVFEVKGFDYHPSMFISETGGLAGYRNIIFSGNHSEYYTHEIMHIYIRNKFVNVPVLLEEGLATLVGGSGVNNYSWHRNKFKSHLVNNKVDLGIYTNAYANEYIDNETPIAYMVGAIICEHVIRLYGKEKLFKTFESKTSMWESLLEVGITKENLNAIIMAELEHQFSFSW